MGESRAVTVDGHSEEWLRKGFPWVYPAELVGSTPRPGARVEVRARSGKPLGSGIATGGFVAVRVFRHDRGPIDAAWLHATLDRAAALRQLVIPPETDGYRLCNAESDGLPGVRIDVWRSFVVITLDRPELELLIPDLVGWLEDRLDPRGIVRCFRPDPRDAAESEPEPAVLAWGHPPRGPIRVLERGLELDVDPMSAPDVGLYADMRDARTWLEPHWGGTRVLNTFAYTGAFSVAAARNGASEVVSVDLSPKVLERAENNFRINGLEEFPHEIVAEDVFRALDRLRRTGRTFDRIVLDPPAFSHGTEIFSAKRDYPRLLAAAARVIDDDGWIVAASNQGELSPKVFDGLLGDGLRKAGCRAQILHVGTQSADFPAASWFPEGRYLKVRVMRILKSS